jgi:anti-anti-sigma factor
MALQLCSDNWQLTSSADEIVVTLKRRELDVQCVSLLVDELSELAHVNENSTVHLDCGNVRRLAGTAFGKFISLAKKLRDRDGDLVLSNVDAGVYQSFRAARLTENLDIRACPCEA